MLRFLLILLFPITALAEPPRVVTDIAPVHSLVANVMQGVGEPVLLLPPGASPHGYSPRPSDALALERADLVIWIGPELTPWLGRSIKALSLGHEVRLFRGEGNDEFRKNGVGTDNHSSHDGADTHEDHDAHDHDAHDKDAHKDDGHGEDGHKDDTHDRDPHEHGVHEHGANDPHAWLDPENAKVWVGRIASVLAEADPANAETYRRNAAALIDELSAMNASIDARLQPYHDAVFVVAHDAYGHFETRFDLSAAGALAGSDATKPGAARIVALRKMLRDAPAACVFKEPQTPDRAVLPLTDGLDVRIGVLDPLGSLQTPGPDLYQALIGAMADAFVTCFKGATDG